MMGMLGPIIPSPVNGTPQRCALVQGNNVINIIVADPNLDPAPEGCILIGLPDDSKVAIGWTYNSNTKEFSNS